jgi:chromosome segregation ATPase
MTDVLGTGPEEGEMSGEFGATGIDPDWYDNGPGSERHKRKMAKEAREFHVRKDEERRAEARRVAGLDAEIAQLKKQYVDRCRDYTLQEEVAGDLRAEIARLKDRLGNLLAVIHRDGGHYLEQHGDAKAVADAASVVRQGRARFEEMEGVQAETEKYLHAAQDSLGEAKAEAAVLVGALEEIAKTKTSVREMVAGVDGYEKNMELQGAAWRDSVRIAAEALSSAPEAAGKMRAVVEAAKGLAEDVRERMTPAEDNYAITMLGPFLRRLTDAVRALDD